MSLRILIAPSGFKESLDADQVARCIETGVLKALPGARTHRVPLVDGGEGFTKALVRATGGTIHHVVVNGPLGRPVRSHFGFLGGQGRGTAVIEMAAAAGLTLVPPDCRDPLRTTTYGVGELIRMALAAGARRLLIGCGDSGTNDGGAGMAQALGVALLDERGAPIGRGGRGLPRLAHIDMSGLLPRIRETPIDVACNWHNVLCGPRGVARVFGPQKGASASDVELLAAGLDNLANVLERDLGLDVRTIPGGGASGGLGAGLHAFLGAVLHPRYDVVMRYFAFDEMLHHTDLVITAEGALDEQTPRGKVPSEVATRAKRHGLPVVALAGTLGQGAAQTYATGIDAFESILEGPCSLQEAIRCAPELVTRAAERLMRALAVGSRLHRAISHPDIETPAANSAA